MKSLLEELRRIINEAADYNEIADDLEQGKTTGISDSFYWEFDGNLSDTAIAAVRNGETSGDDWNLNIDDDQDISLDNFDQRLVALLDYLDEIDEIENVTTDNGYVNGLQVELPDNTSYLVFTDYDDVIDSAKEYIEDTIDDIGITQLFSFDTLKEFLDTDRFQEIYDEDADYLADEQSEEDLLEFLRQEGRLDEFAELKESDDEDEESDDELDEDDLDNWELTDEDGAREAYKDNYLSNYDDPVEWYIDMMGTESLEELIKRDSSVIDMDSLIQYVVDSDGPASQLATYDNSEIEHEYNGEYYYIYRTD